MTNPITRRRFLGTTSSLAAVTAVSPYATITYAQGKKILNARAPRDIQILDPGYMVGGAEIDTQYAVLPRLGEYTNIDGKLGWKPSDYVSRLEIVDSTHIAFTLKPGFMWTNGFGELTTEDVKYSIERMPDTEWGGYWKWLKHVEIEDKYSGTIVLDYPFAPVMTESVCGWAGMILPKKGMEVLTDEKFTLEMPGTCGPYIYTHHPKKRIVYTLNPDWPGPKPEFDEINYILVDDDKAAELAYEAGEVDYTEVAATTVARYMKELPPDTKMYTAGALQYLWLGANTEHPKLKDIRVRQAIQHAVDVDSIIEGAYSGIAERSYGIVSPGLVGKRNETKIDFNPDKSRALLAEAGVSGLELDMHTLNDQNRILAAQIIQANLADVGVSAKVIPLEGGPWWDLGQESKGDMWKDSQLWLMRYGSGGDGYEPFQWFVKDMKGIWNWERWTDDEFDRIWNESLELTDNAEREKIYWRMQEMMEDTGAYTWICHEPEIIVHRTNHVPYTDIFGGVHFPFFKKT